MVQPDMSQHCKCEKREEVKVGDSDCTLRNHRILTACSDSLQMGRGGRALDPPLPSPPFFRLSIMAIPTSAAGGEHCVKDGSEEWRLEALNSGAPSWGTSELQTPVFSISGGKHPLLQERPSQHLPRWCAGLPPSWTCTRPSSPSAWLHFMDSHLWTAPRTPRLCWALTGVTRRGTFTSKPPQTWTTSIWRSL